MPARLTPAAAALPPPSAAARSAERGDATGFKNMQQLIQLRWFAVVGQILTIEVARYTFGVPLPLPQIGTVIACLVLFNAASMLRWRRGRRVANGELFFALLVDVLMLTALLHLSGGATNPFSFLYLLQVTLGAVLLSGWTVWAMVAITTACFVALAAVSPPLVFAQGLEAGLASPQMQGFLVCFVLNAALVGVFITRISRNLRQRDARLASLRQRAAEHEHIVRMGLLASGAAHELGTPLATLAVILGDWRRMPAFAQQPELLQEIAEMEHELQRCKTILSGILLSAGEARGESSAGTTLHAFLDGLVQMWRVTRSSAALTYANHIGPDLPMVSDSAVQQMICNVLDNALEASPTGMHLDATREDGMLVLTVTDTGPGFAPGMLANFGTPYQSTKGRPGAGLGLFLAVNVARTLGGTVSACNRPGGGASVTLRLPLSAVTLEDAAHAD
ncbi:ATP-binding protein [Acidovorax sp. SRB_24]|uniref:ATP-binding protein n=1 Tax=Acidovorax sp. SRB_24 TaxID=1962700 RepID=UPI00145F493B|nr:ATP-binding protein [Acidovorax sp. SRB_24]